MVVNLFVFLGEAQHCEGARKAERAKHSLTLNRIGILATIAVSNLTYLCCIRSALLLLLQKSLFAGFPQALNPESPIGLPFSEPHNFPLTPPPPTTKMTTVNTAPIKWAQRSDSLYITIALQGKL